MEIFFALLFTLTVFVTVVAGSVWSMVTITRTISRVSGAITILGIIGVIVIPIIGVIVL